MIRKILLAGSLAIVGGAALAQATIDLNSASATELAAALEGVGAVRAEAIVEHRTTHGPFTSVGALVNVSGIGEATLEQNRAQLTVGSE